MPAKIRRIALSRPAFVRVRRSWNRSRWLVTRTACVITSTTLRPPPNPRPLPPLSLVPPLTLRAVVNRVPVYDNPSSLQKTPKYNTEKVTVLKRGVVDGIRYYVGPKFRQQYASNRDQLRKVLDFRLIEWMGWLIVWLIEFLDYYAFDWLFIYWPTQSRVCLVPRRTETCLETSTLSTRVYVTGGMTERVRVQYCT